MATTITYFIDANAKVRDKTAILGDLGPLGQTWILAAPGYEGGVINYGSKYVVPIRP